MTSIGTGYDLQNSTFSPDGRNFQAEYAVKAVENGNTTIGIKCKDGVVLALEKIVTSKLLKPNANRRIATVDRNMGIVTSGLPADGSAFIAHARDEAGGWRNNFKEAIPTSSLVDRMGAHAQLYTMYGFVRPFGINAIIAGWDSEKELPVDGQVGSGPSIGAGGKIPGKEREGGPQLYMVEPSGLYWGYYGAAAGKGRQAAKAELEKLNLHESTLSLHDAVREAARIIYVAHEETKDKEFELEMTWISGADGPTKGRHMQVPKALLDEAEKAAKKSLEGDDDDDEEETKMAE